MFGRLSPLWPYGFFGKLGVPSYTMLNKTHVVDQVKSFWDLLVHTVKGDYDSYKGYRNIANRKRRRIQRVWSSIPIMLDASTEVKWNYIPPYWLFPPLAPFLVQAT